MISKGEKSDPQDAGKSIEISYTEENGSVVFHNLNLNVEVLSSPEVEVTVEKQPTEIVEGRHYLNNIVKIDKETKKMKSLSGAAEKLLEIPEAERLEKVLEILRNNVNYPYEDDIKKLAEKNPKLAQWITDNVKSNKTVSISEIFEKGYGQCGHLTVAYLWLAQKAGLKGTILTCPKGVIKNIVRTDTGKSLFKSEGGPAHAWVEVQISDGRWIPVDPSVKLIGDSRERLDMFKEANYKTFCEGLGENWEPKETVQSKNTPVVFYPAEPTASGSFHLELKTKNEQYFGEGKLDISTQYSRSFPSLNLKIRDILKK